jgi:hypothetical protein
MGWHPNRVRGDLSHSQLGTQRSLIRDTITVPGLIEVLVMPASTSSLSPSLDFRQGRHHRYVRV